MSEVVTLGSMEEMGVLQEKLSYNQNLLMKQGVEINLNLNKKGQLAMLTCDYNEPVQYRNKDENHLFFRQCMANVISELILSYWESKLIKDLIKEQYYFFTPEEKEKIFLRSLEIIQAGYPHNCENIVYQLNRKSKIINRLSEYLSANNELNIEGFVKFRLRDYTTELSDAVNYAVDEFMMDKEYREFIRLLRYFVEVQEPRLDQVHLVLKKDGKYLLFDDKKKEISSEYLDDFFSDLIDTDINYEDLLISALITIAPKQVLIHFTCEEKGGDTVQTIEQVFADRLEKCHGCDWCRAQ
ncbi:MAG: putative sporulation protein YtxC [Clostridia bacterium]|nr:putative sporulation protein YtxC [Clostridia bacterium]